MHAQAPNMAVSKVVVCALVALAMAVAADGTVDVVRVTLLS